MRLYCARPPREALRRLSVSKRLQLVEDLWDSLVEDGPDEAPRVSRELAAELDRRLAELERNQALNFRPKKVSTIAVVDEQPAEVFRQLYLRELGMRFKAASEEVSPQEQAVEAVIETESTVEGHEAEAVVNIQTL